MPYSLSNRRSSQNLVFQPRKKLLVSAVGGEVFINGDYKHHVFKSTDSFRLFFSATGSTFNYLVVAGASNGSSGGSGYGGKGGSGSYRSAVGENLNRFNPHTGYTVTVGGAGSHSTIATNSTSISSEGSVIGTGGAGGSPDGTSPGCTGQVIEEDLCCEHTCDGDCTTGYGCRGDCDPAQYAYCDQNPSPCECYPYACGTEFVCTTNCEQCTGDEATPGQQGNNGVIDQSLVFGGPYTNVYYGRGGGGGGGGGYGGGGGGAPNGGDGGYPVGSGGNGQANSGVGGGGGGGAENGEYCYNITTCTAAMGSGTPDASDGAGGTGGSGIVFIVYKFQE